MQENNSTLYKKPEGAHTPTEKENVLMKKSPSTLINKREALGVPKTLRDTI